LPCTTTIPDINLICVAPLTPVNSIPKLDAKLSILLAGNLPASRIDN